MQIYVVANQMLMMKLKLTASCWSIVDLDSFRLWYLDPTWLHMAFLMSMPCVWTHCSCASVSIFLFSAFQQLNLTLFSSLKPTLNNKLKPIPAHWALFNFLHELVDHFSLLSLCFPFSFWLSLCALSAPPAPPLMCWDMISGEDLERNDGSSSRPYYMSPGLHKILRRGEEGAKLGPASWAMCCHFTELMTLSLTSPYLLFFWGGGDCWEQVL